MNKLCYRVIFNKVRGMLMVVPDIARSSCGCISRRRQRSASAEVQVRVRPLCYALWLAAGIVSLPSQANIVADKQAPGGQQPTVMATANGLPQVNIQTPNSHGVSRNQYSQFDVDRRGAILNNSHKNIRTGLGGMVAANPWLSKQEASVILNEVKSRNPSQLNGFIEVAGKRAAVVIANPAGITCNGCGFINASRNTLTTGQPVMENGQLKGFRVNGGRVNIEGEGLNDTGADYTQIIAQSVTVNARLHAGELKVVTGRNQVSAEGDVTKANATERASKPAYALDVAALGGMYANKITLTGTEKGVGVRNAGELGAGVGELRLSLDGRLENSGTLQSHGALRIASQGDQKNSGKIVSQQDVALTSEGALHNSGTIVAGGNNTLTARHIESTGKGTIAAGVDNHSALTQAGTLVMTSQGELKAQGQNLARDGIQASGTRIDLTGSQTAADAVALTATQGDITTSDATVAGKTIRAQAASQLINKKGQIASGSLILNAKAIDNEGGLLRQQNREALTLNTGSLLNNQGTIVNEGDTHLKAQEIENRNGLIAGNGHALTLDAGRLANQQGAVQLAGEGTLTLNAAQLDGHQGTLLSAGAMTLKGDRLDLSQAQTQAQTLTLEADTLNHQQGLLSQRGSGDMNLSLSGALDNQKGQIVSGGNLSIASGRLENTAGRIQSVQDLAIDTHGQTLTNTESGKAGILSGGTLSLTSGVINNRSGTLAAAAEAHLISTALTNTDGTLISDGPLTLASDTIDNQRGLLQSGDTLTLDTRGGRLVNTDSGSDGGILAGGDLQLLTGELNSGNGAIFGRNITVNTHQQAFDNQQGRLGAQGTLQIESGTLNNRAGQIESAQDLQLNTHDDLLVNRDGQLIGGETLRLYTGDIDNQHGLLTGMNAAGITAGDVNNQAGTLSGGKGVLTLKTDELQNRGGLVQAGSDLTLDTQGHALINSDSGDRNGIVAMHNLDLRSGGITNQTGFIAAGNQATLIAGELNNVQGQVAGNGGLTFTGRSVDNSEGKLQSAGDIAIDTAGQTLINRQGVIAGTGSSRIDSGALDNQQGQIQGGEDLTLNSGQNALQNQKGSLLSAGTLTLTAGQLDNQSGEVQNVGTGRLILARELDNTGGFIHGGEGLDITAPRLVNRDTGLSGKGIEAAALSLQSDTLDNGQGALRAADSLEMTVRQTLENLSGLVSSAGALTVRDAAQGQALAINNRQGTLIADKEGQIGAASLSGDGQVLSQGNLAITLSGDFHNEADVKARGTLRLTAKGDVTNDGTIATQQALFLTAQNVDNREAGELSAQETHVTAADTLNNSGLIDGGLTRLVADVLTNTGTGRIFGDRIALAAAVINNLSDGSKAAVIAARERLDAAANTINNRDHGLIYSTGDLYIAGQLDANSQATGEGGQLNNDGATIEAGKNATIAMAEVNNTNRHLTTQTVITENKQHHEAVLKGHTDRFDWKDVVVGHKNKYKVKRADMPDGTSGREFYEYSYQRVVKETQIKESDPGKILSGGDLIFTTNRLANHDSQIVAGAALGGQIGELDNQATRGTRVTTDSGTVKRWYAKKKKRKGRGTKTSQGKDTSDYRPAPVTQTIDLKTLSWQANSDPRGQGYQTGNRQQRAVTYQADKTAEMKGQLLQTAVALNTAGGGDSEAPGSAQDRPLVLPAGQQFSLTLPATVADGQTITPVIRAVSPETRLPDNSLFTLQPASDSHYLVETDPRFVNQKQWLGSDYMQNALSSDGSQTLKRLGDGYYEQRLVRDQITQMTGSRYLSGYHSDEDQFRGLMNNGVAFGETYQLELGVALTPAQMALLTSDIVWLVNQQVTLPDGTQQTVLVPQVYAKVKAEDLTGDGALLGGGSVAITAQKDITNSGTIHGREATQLTAQTLTNSGYIDGNQVSLTARQDITNAGGTLRGGNSVSLLAGRDITSQSTLRGDGRDRWVDRPAGIYVQGSDGAMTLSALNNITLRGSDTGNAGDNSLTRIQAGRDLTLDTLTTQHSENDSWGSNNYRRLSQQTDVGTRITTGGDLQLSAGQDIKTRAADVTAGGALTASAGRDIALSTGNSRTDLTEHSKQTSRGFLSASSLETHDELHDRQGISSTLSGDSVMLEAGRDIAVTGSNVAATQDVTLLAGRDLTVTTASESRVENHQREEKKSGLMGTGGIGFTVGKMSQKSTTDATGALNRGSTVGSSDGSVTLSADRTLNVHGSDVIAGKDLTLGGSDVTISAAENSHTSLTKTEQKQSGLTLALSGTVGAALNTAVSVAQTAQDTGDGRLKALQNTKAALSVAQAEQAYELDGAQTAAATAHNDALGLKPGDEGYQEGATNTVGVNLSYGSQSSKSETRTESHQAQGSSLGAGGNVQVTATGAQPGSRGDITVQGSQLQAGGDLGLTAKNDISLLSAQNIERTDSKNSSQGGSVGVGITAGSGGYGISVSASVNAAKGRENGNGLTHTDTMLEAGHALSLNAGRDTTLTGAQVRGDSVKLATGRNLTLTSEQDSDRYDSKQQSASAGGSFVFGSGGSANVSLSQDKMRSNWQSVTEQTGLFAGKGGFDIRTGEHTQLDGAVIASTADSSLNRLDTGTLGFSDIHNRADYKAEHQGAGFSTGGSIAGQFKGNAANALLAGMNNSGSADSTTKAAVSDGTIVIRDQTGQQQDVAGLSRDVENANPGLDKIFNREKEQRRQQQAQLIAEIGSQAADIARTQGELTAMKKATESMKAVTPAQRAAAEKEWKEANPGLEPAKMDITQQMYQTLYDQALKDTGLGTGGAWQQGISAATAAVQGLAGGNVKAALAGGSAPYLAEVIHHQTMTRDAKGKDVVNVQANLIAHAVLGAVVAQASGNNALSGASGAVAGEYIAQQLYPGVDRADLSEEERQTISALGTLAAGLAGGVAGDSTGGAVAGAQAGKNAVENNALSALVQGGKLAAQGCSKIAACRNALVEKGLGALLGIGAANTVLDNLSVSEQEYVFNVAMTGKADLIEKLAPEQREAYDYMVGQDQKGLITIFPQPDRDLTGGKLVNPVQDQNKGTTLISPEQSGQQGATNTGNTEGNTVTSGNTTVSPISDGPNKDDLAYLSDNHNNTDKTFSKNVDPKTLISRQDKNEMSGSQVKRLVKDMKENGFDANNPVDAAFVNGKMIIIDGHHRAQAAAKAGLKDIPVRIHEVTKEQGEQLLREAAEARVRY
uniref:two-partner secretion domain-containing protein n=1 Tax=Pantoea sp. IMH TaxID=1267600 RepID=UPI00046A95AA|nr:hemagglutinin repeat-containing protein [Pantoea sp. IMH]